MPGPPAWSEYQLDPLHPPTHCPQCAGGGVQSRVKKYKLVPGSKEWIIMCKNPQCPWPFSAMTQAEATGREEDCEDSAEDHPPLGHSARRGQKRKRGEDCKKKLKKLKYSISEDKVKSDNSWGEESIIENNKESAKVSKDENNNNTPVDAGEDVLKFTLVKDKPSLSKEQTACLASGPVSPPQFSLADSVPSIPASSGTDHRGCHPFLPPARSLYDLEDFDDSADGGQEATRVVTIEDSSTRSRPDDDQVADKFKDLSVKRYGRTLTRKPRKLRRNTSIAFKSQSEQSHDGTTELDIETTSPCDTLVKLVMNDKTLGTVVTMDRKLKDCDETSQDPVNCSEVRSHGQHNGKGGRDKTVKDGKQRVERMSGRGWFMWRGWRINEKFIGNFSDFLEEVVLKWNPTKNQTVDPRIVALMKEKDESVDEENILKKIQFFAEVFVKYIFTSTHYPNLSMDRLMNILQKHHNTENLQFGIQVHFLVQQHYESPPPSLFTTSVHLTTAGPMMEVVREKSDKQVQAPASVLTGRGEQSLSDSISCSTEGDSSVSVSSIEVKTTSTKQPESNPLHLKVNSLQSEPLDTTTILQDIPEKTEAKPQDIILEDTAANIVKQQSSLVYSDNFCRVEVNLASFDTSAAVGQGEQLVQFFYSNEEIGEPVAMPCVLVNTDEEVKYVVAIVAEMAEEYERRKDHGRFQQQMKYSTTAAMARCRLDTRVVKHIKQCFTKTQMMKMKLKLERRSSTKKQRKKKVVKIVKSVTPEENFESGMNVDGRFAELDTGKEESENDDTIVEDIKNNNAYDWATVYTNNGKSMHIQAALLSGVFNKEASLNEEVVETLRAEVVEIPTAKVELFEEIGLEAEVETTEADSILSTNSNNEERGLTTKAVEDNPTIHFTIKVLEDISILNEEGIVTMSVEIPEDVEEEDIEEEYIPTVEDIRLELELKLFGGKLPKVLYQLDPPRDGTSSREGRGGRNEIDKKAVPDSLKLGVVEYILACKRKGEHELMPEPNESLAVLFQKGRIRRKKINIILDDLTDEDDDEEYKVASVNNKKADRPEDKNRRKSGRLSEKQVRAESGEYFGVENHDPGYFWQDHDQPRYRVLTHGQGQAHGITSSSRPEDCGSEESGASQATGTDLGDDIAMEAGKKDSSAKICNPANVREWVAGKTISEVNTNYLRSSKKCEKAIGFEKVFTRYKHRRSKTVRKLLRRVNKRMKGRFKRTLGTRKPYKMVSSHRVQKASQDEIDLVRELCEIGETAVSIATSAADASVSSNISLASDVISEFEEIYNLVTVDDGNADDDFLLHLGR